MIVAFVEKLVSAKKAIALLPCLQYGVLAKSASTGMRLNEREVIFMASIRKRGSSYLIVVSRGYDYNGNRIRPQQETVRRPEELKPK